MSHDYGRGIEAREAGTIAIGNPFERNPGNLIESQNSVFQIRSRAMRATTADAVKSIRNEVDHVIRELDYMQESLLDVGMMANP